MEELRSRALKEIRRMDVVARVRESTSDPRFADSNETQKFYEAIKTVYGPTHHAVYPVKSKDGNTVIKDLQGILSRWAEHLSELLNCLNPTYPTHLEQIHQFPVSTHSRP